MATYAPYGFGSPFSGIYNVLTSFTGAAATQYIVRTMHVQTATSSLTFTMSFGADGTTTRLFDAYALTANVPSIFNGWWVPSLTGTNAHIIDMKSSSTVTGSVVLTLGGYSFA
jgi:hypothetical protein